jgi:hypothetical protein
MVGERVFRFRFPFKNAAELGAVGGKFRKLEIPTLAEADDEDALAMLWDDALRVDDLVIDRVAEVFGERAINDVEGLAAIVTLEVLDVLQDEGGGAVEVEDVGDGEEEVALLHVLEAVLAAEAQFLRHSRDAEGLAGEAAAEDVVRGDVGDGDAVDVAVRALAEIGLVGLLAEFVVVGREDAFTARLLERDAKAANAAKKVNETAWTVRVVFRWIFADPSALCFPPLPHGSTPAKSSASERRNAFANCPTMSTKGLRSPRSMSLM